MKYVLIKNAPLGSLLDRDGNMRVMWEKYGFSVDHLSRLSVQGKDNAGDFAQVLPITDEATFNTELPNLQAKIDSDLFPNDSIEVLADEAAADIIKAEIASVKAASQT